MFGAMNRASSAGFNVTTSPSRVSDSSIVCAVIEGGKGVLQSRQLQYQRTMTDPRTTRGVGYFPPYHQQQIHREFSCANRQPATAHDDRNSEMTEPRTSRGERPFPPYHQQQIHREFSCTNRQPATGRDGRNNQSHHGHRDHDIHSELFYPNKEPSFSGPQPRSNHHQHSAFSSFAEQPITYDDHEEHLGYDDHDNSLERVLFYEPYFDLTCQLPGHNILHNYRGLRCRVLDCQAWVEQQDHRIRSILLQHFGNTGPNFYDERDVFMNDPIIEAIPNQLDHDGLHQLDKEWCRAGGMQDQYFETEVRATLPLQYREYFDKELIGFKERWTDKRATMKYRESNGKIYASPSGKTWDGELEKAKEERKENGGGAGVGKAYVDEGFEMIEKAESLELS